MALLRWWQRQRFGYLPDSVWLSPDPIDDVAAAQRRLKRERLHPRDLFALLRDERRLWRNAIVIDPLLPRVLCPRGYNGEVAWRCRRRLLQLAAAPLTA